MNSQEFYKSFKHRKKDDHNFFYGLERNEPISSLLFYRNTIGTNVHQFDQDFTENSFYFPDFPSNEIEINGGNPLYTKSIKDMIFSATELYFYRVSTYEFECSLCHHRCSYNDRINHMVSCHSKFLAENFEDNCAAIDDDDEFLNGLMLKLQFDSILTTPTKGYPPACQEACICAPPIFNKEADFDNEEEELETLNTKKRHDYNSKISIRVQGALNPVLTKFANNHQPLPPVSETEVSQELLIDESQNIDDSQTQNELDEITANTPPKQISANIPAPSNLSTPPYGKNIPQTNSPSKSSPQKQQNVQQQISSSVQQTNTNPPLNIQTKASERHKIPSPPSTSNTSVKINSTEQPPSSSPIQAPTIPDGLFEQLSIKDPRKPTPPKKTPKYVPYIESIPSSIRSKIISNLARDFLKSYVSTTTLQIVKPLLQTKKKQHQKKMREEKAKRAKDEERMRLAAMRQRKDNAIQKISNDMVTPIIRSFIRSEIEKIFKEESIAIKESLANTPKNDQNDEVIKTPQPVVLSGLTNRRHLSVQFLREKFAQFKFQLDENNEPKIRFRVNANRVEVLLYLANASDVNAICSQSPMQIEYVNVTLAPETEDNSTVLQSYAQQELTIIPATRHLENFAEDKGRSGFVSMCPVMCLETVTNIDDGEIQK